MLFFSPLKQTLTILLAVLCLNVLGQNKTVLTGKVFDGQSGKPMPGANVYIEGTTIGTQTEPDGTFIISGFPATQQTIKVGFMGYQEQAIAHDFAKQPKYYFEKTLAPSFTELKGVTITGRALGQTKAMQTQKNAENIKTIVSAEQIESFPDMTAADAMQRIAGITLQRDQGEGRFVQLRGTPPEFTVFNVNGVQIPSPEGDVRYVGMDVINADQIENIEVTKVMTPDMNADGIGGTVNIITKKAQDSISVVKASASGGFNNLRKTGNSNLQFSFEQRKGNLGIIVNGSYYYSKQGADNIEFDYEKNTFFGDTGKQNYHLQYREVQLRHYDVTRKRTGLNTTLDYRWGDHTNFYITGMYNNFSDHETRRRKVYTLDDALSERYYLYGGVEHDVRDREKIQQISTLNIGSKHTFDFLELDYELALARAVESEPDYLEAIFDNPGQAIAIKFNLDDPLYPRATFPDVTGSDGAFDYDNYEMDKLLFEDNTTIDENLTTFINAKVPFRFLGNKGYIKTGAQVRSKDKVRDKKAQSFGAYVVQPYIYPIAGDTLSLTRVSDDFAEDNLLNQGYVIDNMPNPDNIRKFYENYPTGFIYGSDGITETRERTFGQDYIAEEDIYAYYVMARQDFEKLTIIGGYRMERTEVRYEGYQILKKPSGYFIGMDTISDRRTRTFVLPNLQLKYRITPQTNIRGALTYNYVRPNFRDIIPYREENQRQEVQYGNPNLDYPKAMNLDFLVERYWGRASILSAGIFYKEIEDFVFNYKIFGYEGDPALGNFSKVELEIPLNGNRALVRGAELQAQFFFDFLPSFFKNFGLFSNYTYTNSIAFLNKRYPANENTNIVEFNGDYLEFFEAEEQEQIQLPGQSPHTTNVALFYDNSKLYLKLSANYSDDFLVKLGADSDLDEYYAEQFRLDFNGYYQVNRMLRIFGDVRNITNAPLVYYLGEPSKVKQQEFYSYWARVGFKLKF